MVTLPNHSPVEEDALTIAHQIEDIRIRRHLRSVEHQLRTISSKIKLKAINPLRLRYLDLLHEYWLSGQFPRNYSLPHQTTPCFIDRDGQVCAVAHLLIATGYSDLASQIADQANNAYITEMTFPALDKWVAESGLTLSELALIQPVYHYCNIPNSQIDSPPAIVRQAENSANLEISPNSQVRFHPSVLSPAIVDQLRNNGGSASHGRSRDCVQAVTPRAVIYQTSGHSPHSRNDNLEDTNFGLTASESPTFFFFVGVVGRHSNNENSSRPQAVKFVLTDIDTNEEIYETTVVPDAPGIISITLPNDEPKHLLKINKLYFWSFVVIFDLELFAIDPDLPFSSLDIGGVIQRIELNSSLIKELESAAPLERAILYAKAGIWHDTLATLAQMRLSSPNDSIAKTEWEELLRSVGLNKIAKTPLLACCQPDN
ncbi:DUF928 domain-containing protein [Coleofasciculus sp. FACHB-64]|uniref:DUF928 domain-containing protein n=1 Tax=Cyanophyceae TaxID=3028117 RepID=UPI001685F4D3|nr:DUF928 domain-containing protein [Coleofasciculus sp. FACHB-64]MBD2045503.1 DUF928 domain-containing protein [Coleofasciculus sp. FACHB-64]